MRDLSKVFKALADETRLLMLGLMQRHGELCVCAFEEGLGISQSRSSRHLRYLANAGLLDDRRDGTWIYYRIKEEPTPEVREILKTLKSIFAAHQFQEAERRLKEWHKELKKTASCRDRK